MLYFQMINIDFPEWLGRELETRGMSQADLARESGLTTSAVSRIMTGSRGAGKDACQAIAKALDLPAEEVYRRAGLLPEKSNDEPPGLAEWMHMFLSATDEQKEEMIRYARYLKEQQKQEDRRRKLTKTQSREEV